MNDLDDRFGRAVADLDRALGPASPRSSAGFRRRAQQRRLVTVSAVCVGLVAFTAGLVLVRQARQSIAPTATTTPSIGVGRGLLTVEDGQPIVLTATYGRMGVEGTLVGQDGCWWFERSQSRTRAAVIFPGGTTAADGAVVLPDGTRVVVGDQLPLEGPLASFERVAVLPEAALAGLRACLGREPVDSDQLAILSGTDYTTDLSAGGE